MLELRSLEEALDFKAPPQAQIVVIEKFSKTPGSDRLTSYQVCGSWTVISSNVDQTEDFYGVPRYPIGAKVAYIQMDSVLSKKLENILIGPEAKIKLNNGRVRQIKLRGAYSQGMIADVHELEKYYPGIASLPVGSDVSKLLEVTKYEPPAPPSTMRGASVSKKKQNPLFKEYIDIKNIKFYTESGVFEEGELVYVSAKLHGTSARYGFLPIQVNTLWKKILNFFKLLPRHEFCFGSRRVQLQEKPKNHKGFYSENVYHIVGERLKIKERLLPGEQLYGEIVGQGIQGGYDYGFTGGNYGFYAYDVEINGRFLPPDEFIAWCEGRGFDRVPNLGIMGYNLEKINGLAGAKTCLNGQKIREGVVVKSMDETPHPACGRRVFKVINPEYLAKDQTDFH